MGQVSPEEFAEAVSELNAVRAAWLARPEVSGVDVGLARTARGVGEGIAIRVYVDPESGGTGAERSVRNDFPSRLGKFPVDVIETTFGPQQQDTAIDDGGDLSN